jgi:hypothetical protein
MADMKKIKYHKIAWMLSIQLLLMFGFVSFGQQNKIFKLENVIESIELNTDRDIYFAGEELFFSAEYFINRLKTKPLISNVIYVELINCAEKNPVVQEKYEIIDFNSNGTIKIPEDIASGSYVLRAYTQYQRNFGYFNFSYHFLTILNPENNKNVFTIGEIAESNVLIKENIRDGFVKSFPKIETRGIQIQIEKNRYAARENVNAQISMENFSGSDFPVVSVAVIKHGTKKENHKSISRYLFAEQISNVKTPTLEYIPEIRGLTLSGIVRNKESQQPVANQNIYLSVPFNYPQLHICKTGEDGSFIFSLNNIRGVNDVFLCPENAENDDYEILITNPFSSEIPNFGEIPALIDSSDHELINELYANAQINHSFYPLPEKELQLRERKNTFNIDNGKSTILMSDFVTLKNMEELFTEIVPTAKYRKNKGKYSFAIFDSKGNITSENPLLLLDKIPIFDANKIMGLNISLIEKVEVINRNYVLGENTFNGVIMLTTKTENFAGIEFPKSSIFIEYPTIQKADDDFSFNEKVSINKRIPDFRTTLFWKPKIQLGVKGFDFNFQTSDSKGAYDVVVKGYASNGQVYFGQKQIIIE